MHSKFGLIRDGEIHKFIGPGATCHCAKCTKSRIDDLSNQESDCNEKLKMILQKDFKESEYKMLKEIEMLKIETERLQSAIYRAAVRKAMYAD